MSTGQGKPPEQVFKEKHCSLTGRQCSALAIELQLMQLTPCVTGPVLHILFHRQAPLLVFAQQLSPFRSLTQTTLFFSRLQVYLKGVFRVFFQVSS